MPGYEYKVIPAPKKAAKIKGIRGTDLKFAASLAEVMNLYARDGWEYQRTDTLPCEERQGFTGKTTVFQNMLVFRRVVVDEPVEMSVRNPTVMPVAAVAPAPVAAPEPQQDATPETADAPDAPPAPALPTFRSSVAANAAPALAAATHDAPEGHAPKLGAASTSEPKASVPAPGLAAQ